MTRLPTCNCLPAVKVTANFQRNLAAIEAFLSQAGEGNAFEALIEELGTRMIPALERFPDIGPDFAAKAPLSREGLVLFERMIALAGPEGRMRQWVQGDYVILYLVQGRSTVLLAIKHHRQLSFDLPGHWP